MSEKAVDIVHSFWDIMYIHGGKVYRGVWEQYGSLK
jgi:hypothetical protein